MAGQAGHTENEMIATIVLLYILFKGYPQFNCLTVKM